MRSSGTIGRRARSTVIIHNPRCYGIRRHRAQPKGQRHTRQTGNQYPFHRNLPSFELDACVCSALPTTLEPAVPAGRFTRARRGGTVPSMRGCGDRCAHATSDAPRRAFRAHNDAESCAKGLLPHDYGNSPLSSSIRLLPTPATAFAAVPESHRTTHYLASLIAPPRQRSYSTLAVQKSINFRG